MFGAGSNIPALSARPMKDNEPEMALANPTVSDVAKTCAVLDARSPVPKSTRRVKALVLQENRVRDAHSVS